MSYTVSIKPVNISDINNLVLSESNMVFENHEQHTSLIYSKDNKHTYFDYSNNEISFLGTPSNFEMKILQDLAIKLNAKVFDEEGEDLTGIEDVDINLEGCGATFYTTFGFIIVLVLYWIFID